MSAVNLATLLMIVVAVPRGKRLVFASRLKRIRLWWSTGSDSVKVSSPGRGYAQGSSSVRRPPCLPPPSRYLAAPPKADAIEEGPECERGEDARHPEPFRAPVTVATRIPIARAPGFLWASRAARHRNHLHPQSLRRRLQKKTGGITMDAARRLLANCLFPWLRGKPWP